jgi:mercuric ion transport protein
MPSTVRKRLPNSLTGLAGLACALCCAIPALITAGILGGTAWASLGQLMPGIAVVLWQSVGSRASHSWME